MILNCPNCTTRFVVKSEDIGKNGRKVKCSKCGHKWFHKGADEQTELKQTKSFSDDSLASDQFNFSDIDKLIEFKKEDFSSSEQLDTSAKLEAIRRQVESTHDVIEESKQELKPEPKQEREQDISETPLAPFQPKEENIEPISNIAIEPTYKKTEYTNNTEDTKIPSTKTKSSLLLKTAFLISAILLVLIILNFSQKNPELLSNIYGNIGHYNTEKLELVDVNYKIKNEGIERSIYVNGGVKNNSNEIKQVPKIKITAYSSTGQVIKKVFISLTQDKIKPNEKVAFSQNMTEMPLNTDKIIVDLGNSLEILQR